MDIGAITSNTAIVDSEEDDRAFIEISELDRLLGLPPPRFDLGAADIVPLRVRNSGERNSFHPSVEFGLPLKSSSSPQPFEPAHIHKTDAEVSFNNKLANVSVIKSELNIGSDGQEVETECNSYLIEQAPSQPLSPASNQGKSMACCCVYAWQSCRSRWVCAFVLPISFKEFVSIFYTNNGTSEMCFGVVMSWGKN